MTGRKQEHPTIQTPTMKKGINSWCEESRPREKLLRFGAEHLEVPELMAILIGGNGAHAKHQCIASEHFSERGRTHRGLVEAKRFRHLA